MEKVYVVPLRKAFRAPSTKRARRAMELVRFFLQQHLKSDDVRLGASINDSVWARGMCKIPRRVRIHAEKDDKGVVRAEMMGVEIKVKEIKPKEKEEKIEEVKTETKPGETKKPVELKPAHKKEEVKKPAEPKKEKKK